MTTVLFLELINECPDIGIKLESIDATKITYYHPIAQKNVEYNILNNDRSIIEDYKLRCNKQHSKVTHKNNDINKWRHALINVDLLDTPMTSVATIDVDNYINYTVSSDCQTFKCSFIISFDDPLILVVDSDIDPIYRYVLTLVETHSMDLPTLIDNIVSVGIERKKYDSRLNSVYKIIIDIYKILNISIDDFLMGTFGLNKDDVLYENLYVELIKLKDVLDLLITSETCVTSLYTLISLFFYKSIPYNNIIKNIDCYLLLVQILTYINEYFNISYGKVTVNFIKKNEKTDDRIKPVLEFVELVSQ